MQFSLQSAVSYLCGNGMIEMLDLLEDVPGIDWDHADTEGNTPLHFAAQAGHVEVVSFLLNRYAQSSVYTILSRLIFTIRCVVVKYSQHSSLLFQTPMERHPAPSFSHLLLWDNHNDFF